MLKVATFNANSIRSRLDIILDWFAEHQPDILAVQETKAQNKDFPIGAIEEAGLHCVYEGEKSYNGVALISKKKLDNISFGLDTDPTDPTRLVAGSLGPVRIVNTYIPQGRETKSPMFQYKLDWLARLRDYFERNLSPAEPLLWVGDLNAAMDERDVHDAQKLWGSVCYCQEVIDGINAIKEWGFTDTFREKHEQGELYTFWDYRVPNGFKRNIGWRLDYVMATKPLAETCVSCEADKKPRTKPRPSDHTFLVAEFDFDPANT